MVTFQQVIERLEGVSPSGNGYQALCPAHDDHNPSLSVSKGDDGRILLYCHAGCPYPKVIEALEINGHQGEVMAEPRRGRSSKPRLKPYGSVEAATEAALKQARKEIGNEAHLAATYRYRTPRGAESFRVLRFETGGKKTFRPVSPCGKGWAVTFPQGSFPLYRLPELEGHDEIYVVEGEKAAEAGAEIGLATTTAASGSGGARRSDWSPLAGKRVVLLPDNDDPGERWLEKVGQALAELDPAPEVRVVRLPGLPAHGDIVEFIEAGREGQKGGELDRRIRALAEAASPSVSSVSAEMGGAGDSWLDPEPLSRLADVPTFDTTLLPDALRPWVEDIAERMQCPPEFIAVPAMVGLGSVVGRTVGICPKRQDDWLVVPNLWGFIVGRPGVLKSPAVAEALLPLKRLEVEAKRDFDAETERYKAQEYVQKIRLKETESSVRKALRSNADAERIASEAMRQELSPPSRRRYVVNDSTVEKLGEILRDNPRGVLVHRDELMGWLRSLEKEGREGDRAFYLEAWNGDERFTYDRIGRGTVDIEAACISIFGSIQPGPLGKYQVQAQATGASDDGLMQRFQLMVWPDLPAGWKNVDRKPDLKARHAAFRVYEFLDRLQPSTLRADHHEHKPDGIPFLRFSEEAQRLFDDWRATHELRIRAGGGSPAMEAHLSKYRSLVPALALLLHLADGGLNPVGAEAMMKALGWIRFLEAHAYRIYGAAENPNLAAARLLAPHLLRRKLKEGFTVRELYRKGWAGLTGQAIARKAVEYLEDLGWIRGKESRGEGRPTVTYEINPKIWRAQPKRADGIEETLPLPVVDGGPEIPGTLPLLTDKTDETPPASNCDPDESSNTLPLATDRTDEDPGAGLSVGSVSAEEGGPENQQLRQVDFPPDLFELGPASTEGH